MGKTVITVKTSVVMTMQVIKKRLDFLINKTNGSKPEEPIKTIDKFIKITDNPKSFVTPFNDTPTCLKIFRPNPMSLY